MPTFQILQCYEDSCKTFQVQQVKKVNKWTCKVCGAKQSLQKVFFESGAAADCRPVVQQLNYRRAELDEAKTTLALARLRDGLGPVNEDVALNGDEVDGHQQRTSQWAGFDDDEDADVEEDALESSVTYLPPVKASNVGAARKRRRGTSDEAASEGGWKRKHDLTAPETERRGFPLMDKPAHANPISNTSDTRDHCISGRNHLPPQQSSTPTTLFNLSRRNAKPGQRPVSSVPAAPRPAPVLRESSGASGPPHPAPPSRKRARGISAMPPNKADSRSEGVSAWSAFAEDDDSSSDG
ncbi:Sperm associated antigen 1 [Borealophlyctis nickersoniae]|nr:Sperm associated antigen 1 [Borealophlyctis nickersoniae]